MDRVPILDCKNGRMHHEQIILGKIGDINFGLLDLTHQLPKKMFVYDQAAWRHLFSW